MARKVLLTGGAGFIGSHTFVALVEAGYDVVVLDDFSNSHRSVLDRLARITGPGAVDCHEGSVDDPDTLEQLFDRHRFDAVVHFAARKAVGESVARPLDYLQTNLCGLVTLLRAMKAAGVMRLVFSSSATIYGAPDLAPLPETSPRSYANPYGFTKLVGEQILEQAAVADPWAFGVLRYFNPVGAHRSGLIGEDGGDRPGNLMPYVAKVAAGELPHLEVFGNDYPTPDGTGVRDYVHVEDLAEGHVASLDALFRTGRGHVVNLGTGRGTSVLELVDAFERATGRPVPRVIAPRRPGDVPAYVADVSAAREVLGFEARRGLDEMCASAWRWAASRAQTA